MDGWITTIGFDMRVDPIRERSDSRGRPDLRLNLKQEGAGFKRIQFNKKSDLNGDQFKRFRFEPGVGDRSMSLRSTRDSEIHWKTCVEMPFGIDMVSRRFDKMVG